MSGNTKMKIPAILVEGGFMDSTTDIIAMRSDAKLKAQGVAIAEGLAEYFKLKKKQVAGDTFYRVVTGSYNDKKNAEAQIARLKKAGFDSFIDVFRK